MAVPRRRLQRRDRPAHRRLRARPRLGTQLGEDPAPPAAADAQAGRGVAVRRLPRQGGGLRGQAAGGGRARRSAAGSPPARPRPRRPGRDPLSARRAAGGPFATARLLPDRLALDPLGGVRQLPRALRGARLPWSTGPGARRAAAQLRRPAAGRRSGVEARPAAGRPRPRGEHRRPGRAHRLRQPGQGHRPADRHRVPRARRAPLRRLRHLLRGPVADLSRRVVPAAGLRAHDLRRRGDPARGAPRRRPQPHRRARPASPARRSRRRRDAGRGRRAKARRGDGAQRGRPRGPASATLDSGRTAGF